jgi:hypothetical protein
MPLLAAVMDELQRQRVSQQPQQQECATATASGLDATVPFFDKNSSQLLQND